MKRRLLISWQLGSKFLARSRKVDPFLQWLDFPKKCNFKNPLNSKPTQWVQLKDQSTDFKFQKNVNHALFLHI